MLLEKVTFSVLGPAAPLQGGKVFFQGPAACSPLWEPPKLVLLNRLLRTLLVLNRGRHWKLCPGTEMRNWEVGLPGGSGIFPFLRCALKMGAAPSKWVPRDDSCDNPLVSEQIEPSAKPFRNSDRAKILETIPYEMPVTCIREKRVLL